MKRFVVHKSRYHMLHTTVFVGSYRVVFRGSQQLLWTCAEVVEELCVRGMLYPPHHILSLAYPFVLQRKSCAKQLALPLSLD